MSIQPLEPVPALVQSVTNPKRASAAAASASFAGVFERFLDGVTDAIQKADGMAGAVAAGHGDIPAAAIARAKADIMLETAAVAASRVNGAVSALLQTQI